MQGMMADTDMCAMCIGRGRRRVHPREADARETLRTAQSIRYLKDMMFEGGAGMGGPSAVRRALLDHQRRHCASATDPHMRNQLLSDRKRRAIKQQQAHTRRRDVRAVAHTAAQVGQWRLLDRCARSPRAKPSCWRLCPVGQSWGRSCGEA